MNNTTVPATDSLTELCTRQDLLPAARDLVQSGRLELDESHSNPVYEANMQCAKAFLSVWSRMLSRARSKKMLTFDGDSMVLCPRAEGKSYLRRLWEIPKYEIFFSLGHLGCNS